MKITPEAFLKLPVPLSIGCTQLPWISAPVAGSNDAQYMNVIFSVPEGSFGSQAPFAFASRQPSNSSLPLTKTNCEADW